MLPKYRLFDTQQRWVHISIALTAFNIRVAKKNVQGFQAQKCYSFANYLKSFILSHF